MPLIHEVDWYNAVTEDNARWHNNEMFDYQITQADIQKYNPKWQINALCRIITKMAINIWMRGITDRLLKSWLLQIERVFLKVW